MKLRDYQREAADNIMREWGNVRSTLVVMPTGTGKTVLFADIIRQMQPQRAMVLAHREELIFQARDKIGAVTGLDVQIEMADYRADEHGMFSRSPVVVSTVQTHTAGGDGWGRMSKFDPANFGLLIIDEAHHATAQTYRRCVEWYQRNPTLKVLGVTATPDRADEAALGQVFESVAYDYEILDAINGGWLVPIEQQVVHVSGLDYSRCRTTAGDLNGADLAEVLEMEKNLHGIAEPTIKIAGERRAVIFAATVAQAERLTEIFNRYKPGCAGFVCGATDKDDRRRILTNFADGLLQFVVNVGVLTEGFDDAGVELIVMARPTKSRALYAQMAGRGTRPAADIAGLISDLETADDRCKVIAGSSKPRCLIVDFAGNAGRHKLMTSADILGGKIDDEILDRVRKSIDDAGKPVDVSAEIEKAKAEAERARLAEAARRAQVRARVDYRTSKVNPFDVFALIPAKERGWDVGKSLTERQENVLRKQGIDPDTLTYAQGKQLLNELFRRWDAGLATYGQTKILQRNGIMAPMRREDASKLIDQIAKRQGWGKQGGMQ